MKCLVGWVVMFIAFGVWADQVPPALEYKPEPEYPLGLGKMGLSGDVRVAFVIKPDGSAVDPKILYSTHPDFAGATLEAVRQWRFSSWPIEGDSPKEIKATTSVVFNAHSNPKILKIKPGFDITAATCRQFNLEVEDLFRHGHRHMPLQNLSLFQITRSRLIDGYVKGRYSNEQLSTGLYDLSQQMKAIVRTCQRKTSRKFVDMLPESTQALLLAGTVNLGAMEQKIAAEQ